MQIDSDNYVITRSNAYIRICVFSTIGQREDQQDRAGFVLNHDDGIVVVCDGMGGHRGGRTASTLGVQRMLEAFERHDFSSKVQDVFVDVVTDVDQEIAGIKDDGGQFLKAGTTIVSALFSEKCVSWVSVGDSRLYLVRGKEIIQITKDHTYELALKENRDAGLISEDFYEKQSVSSDALISFLGVNGLPIIDSNTEPFRLLSGDRVLLMTDGLYKYISDSLVREIVGKYEDVEDAARIIDHHVQQVADQRHVKRDNMTIAIVEVL